MPFRWRGNPGYILISKFLQAGCEIEERSSKKVMVHPMEGNPGGMCNAFALNPNGQYTKSQVKNYVGRAGISEETWRDLDDR